MTIGEKLAVGMCIGVPTGFFVGLVGGALHYPIWAVLLAAGLLTMLLTAIVFALIEEAGIPR